MCQKSAKLTLGGTKMVPTSKINIVVVFSKSSLGCGENHSKFDSYFFDNYFLGQPIRTALFVGKLHTLELLLRQRFFSLTAFVELPRHPKNAKYQVCPEKPWSQ